MLKRYFFLIYFFLISYVGFSYIRNFGNDKFIKNFLMDKNINKFETLFIIERDFWPSSYYLYVFLGKEINICLKDSSQYLSSKVFNETLPRNRKLTNLKF